MTLTIRSDNPQAELGLYDGQNQVAYMTWEAHRALAETLHTKIAELLKSQSVALTDITGIVVFQGPGSFTGLRIGMSVANALAYSQHIPVVASGGTNWLSKGIDLLSHTKPGKYVLPEYGAPVHITQQKK